MAHGSKYDDLHPGQRLATRSGLPVHLADDRVAVTGISPKILGRFFSRMTKIEYVPLLVLVCHKIFGFDVLFSLRRARGQQLSDTHTGYSG